ncbi:MAG: hypothetical protein Q9163_003991, partial [Psora crenata]
MNVPLIPRSAKLSASILCRPCLRRHLHATAGLQAGPDTPKLGKRRSKEKSRDTSITPSNFVPYTEEDLAKLRQMYTPAQMAAIEAGEAAIDTKDLAEQARFRDDPFAITYDDDFSKRDPTLDKAVRAPEENYDPTSRFKTGEEITADFADWVDKLPKEPTGVEYHKFIEDYRLMTGKEEAERNPVSYLAPPIPKGIPSLAELATPQDEDEVQPAMRRLMRQTGFSLGTILSFRVKSLVNHRVVNQTRMGKIQSIYYLTIAGNQRGLLGIGEGKSTEAEDAKQQAHHAAIRNLQPIPRYEMRTIYGDVKGKVGAVELELMNRPPGFGLRCQYLIYEICRCAGINDLAARVNRSRNPMNTIKATFQALMSQRTPDDVARGLGRKLVDARKVYYGGN